MTAQRSRQTMRGQFVLIRGPSQDRAASWSVSVVGPVCPRVPASNRPSGRFQVARAGPGSVRPRFKEGQGSRD